MRYSKTEFWVATAIILFIIFHLVLKTASVVSHSDDEGYFYFNTYAHRFSENGLRFRYLQHHMLPLLSYYLTVYFSFLLINFYIYPKLYLQKKYNAAVVVSLLVFIGCVIAFSVTDTWHKGYMRVGFGYYVVYNLVLVLLLFGAFAVYFMLKETNYVSKYVDALALKLKHEFQIVSGIWLSILLLSLLLSYDERSYEEGFIAFWFAIIPCAYFLFTLNRYALLPEYEGNNKLLKPYLLKLLSYSLIIAVPAALLFCVLINDFEPPIFFVFWFGQLVVVGSLSWLVYRLSRNKANQIVTLKKELGQTTADLQFLRSQVNPHFLFNALNTLYGTALQENSERTAQGIQMLGDMMRFMLHENYQNKILLTREIEYMRNYIELQSLRTSTSPDIVIQTRIDEVPNDKYIAPMLLIPFVENAFKHGISLKQKSWIRITLHYEQDKLYFDVYNSTHTKQELDPEKNKSGVGLENVKQRLALLYPEKHELVIRETLEEFFVHLTLQL